MARLGSKRRRQAMTEYDIFMSIGAFLAVTHSLLLAWQLIAPMKYQLKVLDVDQYGNPIEGYGYCALEGDIANVIFGILIIFVTLLIIVGNIVCFISRNDESVNSEVTYISISMMNFLLILLVGIPVVVVLVEKPLSRFLVLLFAVFGCFMGLVLLIFMPKVMAVAFEDEVTVLTTNTNVFKHNYICDNFAE